VSRQTKTRSHTLRGRALLTCALVAAGLLAAAPSRPATAAEPPAGGIRLANGATLTLYGGVDMLTYYDTTSPAISDWLAFVYPEGTTQGDEDSFSMAVRASKVGMKVRKPGFVGSLALNAQIEADFVGGFSTGSTVPYSPLMRMKQAWVSLDGEHLSLLMGQSFGIFGGLFPSAGSWMALGTSGNPWIRLPQVRLTYKRGGLIAQVSANRPMAANVVAGGTQDDIISDGERSNLPFVMGRLGYAAELGPVRVSTAASGVFGREKIITEASEAGPASDTELDVWMAVYELSVSTRYVDLSGEVFSGRNLNTFYGGIIQGVNMGGDEPVGVRSKGGWAQVRVKPTDAWFFNLGAGMDDPEDDDLGATGRTRNQSYYLNVNRKIGAGMQVMLEGSRTTTEHGDLGDNTNDRVLARVRFSF